MFTKKSYLTPNQVAELLMVSPSAIRLWTDKGELKATTTAGGHRRFKFDDIKLFAESRNIELNTSFENNSKILIVDDDVQFAKLLKTLLLRENETLNIETSFDGFDAGVKLKEFNPGIVLLDLKMPQMDGFQVCSQIKRDPTLKHIRVISMSGDVNESVRRRIIDAGAEACFQKPINISLLNQLIKNEEVIREQS